MSRARRHSSAAQAGMTLMEILIVLAIVGLLILLLPGQINRVRKSELRSDAARVAAAMRSGYDRAAATAAHHRLILDLDHDSFQLERCEGPIKLVRSADESQAEEAQKIAAQMAKPPEPPPPIDLSGAAPASGAPAPKFELADEVGASAAPLPCEPVKGELGKVQTLAKGAGVTFKEVHVSHLEKPADAGRVTVNFFPLGRGERAIVTLTDKDENVYSVRLHAITGRAQVSEGELRHAARVLEQAETEGAR